VRCGLSSGSGDQLCGPPAILLWSWVLAVLVYWGLVTLPSPLPLGQGQRSVSWLPVVSMLCWFVDCFSILRCHLTLDVAHWFKRQALWTAICPISGSGKSPAYCQHFCLSRICLLISSLPHPLLWPGFVYWKFPWGSAPCSSPLFWCIQCTLPPLLCVPFQFLVYYSGFFGGGAGVSLSRGLCWFISGVAVGISCAIYSLMC
jgi:hypothetical protein